MSIVVSKQVVPQEIKVDSDVVGRSLPPAKHAQPQASVSTEQPLESSSEAQPTPEPSKPQDPRMEELERKERAIWKMTKQLKADREALESARQQAAQSTGNQSTGMTAEQWKEAFLQDPTKLGIDMDMVAQKFLTQPSEEAKQMAELRREIEELRAKDKEREERLNMAQQQAYENAKKQIKTEATRLITTKPQEYETIAAMGQLDAVVQLIERTYQEENILMSVEEAANEVESYLAEQALKYAGLEKVRAKLGQAGTPPASNATQTVTVEKKTPPSQQTLTRALSQSTGTLTAKERRERAIAAFNGMLK